MSCYLYPFSPACIFRVLYLPCPTSFLSCSHSLTSTQYVASVCIQAVLNLLASVLSYEKQIVTQLKSPSISITDFRYFFLLAKNKIKAKLFWSENIWKWKVSKWNFCRKNFETKYCKTKILHSDLLTVTSTYRPSKLSFLSSCLLNMPRKLFYLSSCHVNRPSKLCDLSSCHVNRLS